MLMGSELRRPNGSPERRHLNNRIAAKAADSKVLSAIGGQRMVILDGILPVIREDHQAEC
jgi:hypothetical protein